MARKETIWVAVALPSVIASSSLIGIANGIGAKYPTVKKRAKGVDGFWILTAVDGATRWDIKRVELTRIEGRGGKREAKGFLGYKG